MNLFVGELVGTAFLILLGDGVVAGVVLKKSKAYGAGWLAIATGWGLAVAMAVYVAGWSSGGHINPAVTIGMAAVGKVAWGEVPIYLGGQFLGAFLGAVLVWISYYPHWSETDDPATKLGVFSTIPAIRAPWSNLLCETIATAALVFGVFGIANENNDIATGFGPVAIGMLVFAIGVSLGGPTGYAINPARDLGPRIAHAILPIPGKGGSDWRYAWIPIIGPTVGGVIGALLYHLLIADLTPLP